MTDERFRSTSHQSSLDTANSRNTEAKSQARIDEPALRWQDIPGWFLWRDGQEEAVAHFSPGSTFIEVGSYLGRSLCSLAEVVTRSGKSFTVVGVDTCLGSGPEGNDGIDHHGAAVAAGGGTLAGLLHRNLISCGFANKALIVVGDSEATATLFADASLAWVHLDARHDYESVAADISAWLPKVMPGGWLSGDDYIPSRWPGVVAAVNKLLPQAQPWSTMQWRWVNDGDV
ncbi:class I SAM-dependent methyltransferase [Nocardia brasiliensis]|uniref:class I SAM-dependent methyltransferase n=1 Tax=Streptomyces sp. NPDC056056 TaxID=3345698 RepID=UPI0035D5FC18